MTPSGNIYRQSWKLLVLLLLTFLPSLFNGDCSHIETYHTLLLYILGLTYCYTTIISLLIVLVFNRYLYVRLLSTTPAISGWQVFVDLRVGSDKIMETNIPQAVMVVINMIVLFFVIIKIWVIPSMCPNIILFISCLLHSTTQQSAQNWKAWVHVLFRWNHLI